MINILHYYYFLNLMKEILNKLSKELDIPVEEILRVYKAYWKFIKVTIENLPLKEDLNENTFNVLKTNFNISNLGKLSCTYPRYKVIKDLYKRKNNDKYKED